MRGCEEESDCCWICLQPIDAAADDGFKCCMPSHTSCLKRWQLRRIGRDDELTCRLCKASLPDWLSHARHHMDASIAVGLHLPDSPDTCTTMHISTASASPAKAVLQKLASAGLSEPDLTLTITMNYEGLIKYKVPITAEHTVNRVIWATAHSRWRQHRGLTGNRLNTETPKPEPAFKKLSWALAMMGCWRPLLPPQA